MSQQVFALSVLCLCIFQAVPAYADSDENTCYINVDPHPCLTDNDPVIACSSALEEDPNDLRTRLSLCGAHLQNKNDADRLVNAFIVVSKGLDLCGSNKFVCQRYKYAKSMIEENEETGTGIGSGPDWEDKCNYARTLCLNNRSNKLSLDGCDRALLCYPNDATLYAGKGDKLLARKYPAEAVGALRNAIRLDSGSQDIQAKLADANAARAALAAECVKGISVDVCNRALLPGEPDEFDVRYRRGQLLQVEGNQSAALQAFINAQKARPDDADLARELVTLLYPAISESPDNVEYLCAHGLALLTVGSTDESIAVLKRARQISPEDPDTARILKSARADRSARVDRECLSGSDATRCREMILVGEPDEYVIRAHMARIHRDAGNLDTALAEAKKAAKLAPDDAQISALMAEVRTLAEPPPVPEPEPELEQQPDAGATPTVVAAGKSDRSGATDETISAEGADADRDAEPEPVKFSNAAHDDGRTY